MYEEEGTVSSFVLVHGSWHGAWCWHKIVPRLRARGHEVVVPDLPGHGRDATPASEVTLAAYVDRVVEAVEEASEPVVLVGHSRGGIAISEAVERAAERVRVLVYVAAFLLRDGECVLDLARLDRESLVLPNLILDAEGRWDMLREEAFESALYADCSADDLALAHALLTPEPALPSRTRLRLTRERFGTVPRVYVELSEDRAVTPSLQRRMIDAAPCDRVVSLAASHSAYFSKPGELAAIFDAVAADGEIGRRPETP